MSLHCLSLFPNLPQPQSIHYFVSRTLMFADMAFFMRHSLAPSFFLEDSGSAIGAEFYEGDATIQKSVKGSAFSLNGVQEFSE